MKVETKLKRIEKRLIEKNFFTEEEAKKAIAETLKYVDIQKETPSYFVDFLLSTYNVVGVAR